MEPLRSLSFARRVAGSGFLKRAPLLASIALLCAAASANADNGTWLNSSGLWSDPLNWAAGIVADGSGFTADFSTLNLLGDNTVLMDAPHSLTGLIFGDTDPGTAAGWTLGNSGSALTLSGTTPTITVNALGSGANVTLSSVIAGTVGMTKAGAGNLVLAAANTYTGTTFVNRGLLSLNFAAPGAPVSNILTTAAMTLQGGSLSMIGAAGANNTQSVGALVLNSGMANISVTPGAGGTASLSFASAVRTASVNNANVGGLARFSTTGTIKVGTAASALLIDAGANPYATFGLDDWAATDATGTVVAAVAGTAYSDYPASASINGLTVNAARLSNTGGPITLTNGATATATLRGVLVTSSSLGGTITGGFVRPNRVSTAEATFSVIQNSLLGDLTIASNVNNASSGAPVAVIKAGAGRVILTSANGYTAQTFLEEGTLSISQNANLGLATTGAPLNIYGGTLQTTATMALDNGGGLNARNVVLNGGATFETFPSTTLSVPGLVSGAGSLTKTGDGTLALTGANFYTGGTVVKAGTVNINGIFALGGGVYGGLTLDAGTLQFASTLTSGSDVTVGKGLKLAAGGGTIDTNGNAVIFANSVGNGGLGGFIKTGAGSLRLDAAGNYAGSTVVNAGSLILNSLTGSATGSGNVTVNSGGTLSGNGTVAGSLTLNGGTLTPGTGFAVGTLNVGSLNLSIAAGMPTLNYEFSGGTTYSMINVGGALSLDGGRINLFSANSSDTTAWTTAGTYHLFSYTGTLSGVPANLSIGNPSAALQYSFASVVGTAGAPNFITLTIAGTVAASNWTATGSGLWSGAGNWSGGIPSATGDSATFGAAITAPGTVSLDSARKVGVLVLNSANAYTIEGPGVLTLDNGKSTASINVTAGSHVISAPLSLVSNSIVTVSNAADLLLISGAIANASSVATLTKTGPGTLELSGANSYGPAPGAGVGTVLSTGTLRVSSTGALGGGDLSLAGAGTLQAGVNGVSLANNMVISAGTTATVDTQANTLTLGGVLGESAPAGNLTKIGSGTLILQGANTFSGTTTISAGSLQLADAPGGGGSLTGPIVNNGTLVLKRSDDYSLLNVISGTGGLIHSGTGTATLSSPNTFQGDTVISGGTLNVENSLGLQGSTLDYSAQGGAVSFGFLGAATLGGLKGNAALSLTNTFGGALTMTIGGNNRGTTYSGALSGIGANLIKQGTGTLVLSGANSYTGNTSVGLGVLQLAAGGVISGNALSTSATANQVLISGGSLTALALSTIDAGGSNFLMTSGSATFNGGIQTTTNDGSLIRVDGGTFIASDLNLRRTASFLTLPAAASTTSGFYVTGGTVSLGTVRVGTSNSSASMRIDGGNVSVSGALSIGLTSNSRYNVVQVNGGTLTSSDAFAGIVMSPSTVTANSSVLLLTGGVTTSEIISMGAPALTAGNATVSLNGGALYLGTGGIVQLADVGFVSALSLSAGTLGAKADWSTAIPVNMLGAVAIKAADATDSVSSHISLNGSISGVGGFTKTGAGTLTLAGADTYTGETVVSAGTLDVAGTLSGTSLRAGPGSTLVGLGTITPAAGSALTVLGTLSAKAIDSVGTLNLNFSDTNKLAFGAGATLRLDIDGATADLINFSAKPLTGEWLSGAGLVTLTLAGNIDYTQTYTLFKNAIADGTVGTMSFASITGFNSAFYNATLTSSGNDYLLGFVPVPEPGALHLLLAGLSLSLGIRRFRRRP